VENAPAYAIESVDNVLLLLLLLRRDGSLRVSTAAAELGVARSTAHRLLAMLRYRDFVVQEQDRTYKPGPAFAGLGLAGRAISLTATARPHLHWLSSQVHETVNLMTLSGDDIRFTDSAEGRQVLRVGSRTGVVLPAHRTSGGKVLLAELRRSELMERHPKLDPDSPEMTSLFRALALTRRRGYGTNFEESEPGVTAIAVAVRDAEGVAVAALSISAPTVRFRRAQIVELLPGARAAADRIRQDLMGYTARGASRA